MRKDDLDGTLGAERRVFSDQGKFYEIDLTPANHEVFDQLLQRFKECGREIPNPYIEPDVFHDYKRPVDGILRKWAWDMGLDNVPVGGRINGDIVEAHKEYSVLGVTDRLDRLRLDPRFHSQPTYGAAGGDVTDEASGTAVNRSRTRKSDRAGSAHSKSEAAS
jgi:hypothetical protein